MINFITRYFSSLWEFITAPLRLIWRGIERLFPPRDCTIMDTHDGTVSTYQQSSFWRFTKFCAVTTMTIWAAWSTYVYIYHRPLLQKRTQQLEQMREQHNRHMTDLKTYLKKYNDNYTTNIPKGMRGMAIVLVTAGLLSLAFMGFSGVDCGLRTFFGLD